MSDMRRREFISLLGGAATAGRSAARAQQPAMPVIGFLSTSSPAERTYVTAFRQGFAKPAMSKARMWRSSIAGRRTNTIDCRPLQPIWYAVRWR